MKKFFIGFWSDPFVSLFLIVFVYLFINNLWFWAQQPGVPDLLSNASQWRTYFGQGDAGSYLMVARDLVGDLSVDVNNRWALQLWPPGMPFLEYAIISLFGAQAVVLALACLTSALWSSVFVLFLRQSCIQSRNLKKIMMAALILFVFPQLPVFPWTGQYFLFNSEPIGLALFSIAVIKLWPMLVSNDTDEVHNLKRWAEVGLLVGVASYFRAPFFPLGPVIFSVLLLHNIVTFNWRRLLKTSLTRHFGAAVIFASSFCVTVAPWLIVSANSVRPGFISWTKPDDMGIRAWTNKSDPTTPSWYASSGPGWACDIAPEECIRLRSETLGNQVLQKQAIRAIINEPVQFISNRSKYFFRATFIPISGTATLLEAILNFSSTAFLPVVFLIELTRRKFLAAMMVLFISAALLVPPSLYHFEPRYIAPLKILGGLLLIQEFIRQKNLRSKEVNPEP